MGKECVKAVHRRANAKQFFTIKRCFFNFQERAEKTWAPFILVWGKFKQLTADWNVGKGLLSCGLGI